MNDSKIDYLNIDKDWLGHFRMIQSDKGLASLVKQMQDKSPADILSADDLQRAGIIERLGSSGSKNVSPIAILNIKGALMYSGAWWHSFFGLTAYNIIEEAFNQLVTDKDIKTIILRIQSPGGTAFGASELSQKIYDARKEKRIVSYADPYAFSAAYEVGSAAHEFYVTPSGMVGSVGSYSMHVDYSESLQQDGIKVTFVKAGEKKVDGNAFEPLSERAKKDIQLEVDRFYDVFVADVARNRGVSEDHVKENFGKGGRVMATEAVQVGMVDGIASFNDFLSREAVSLQETFSGANSKAFIRNNLQLLDLEDI